MAFCWRADAAGPSLNARMITDFQGIRTRIAEKPYIFVIFRGGGGASGSADVLWRRIFWRPSIFYCCSHCIRGLPVVLSRRKRTSWRKISCRQHLCVRGVSLCCVLEQLLILFSLKLLIFRLIIMYFGTLRLRQLAPF